jgi:serine/threonine protein kinase/WD40 repeat protein
MSDASSEFDPVEKLVDSFLQRYRRGERPSLSEYTRQHPELADQIRELFPALVVVEELGSIGDLAGPAPKQNTPSVPQQLGEYRIVREIGRGGMGIVYEAVQGSLGRQVALKVLPFHGLMNPVHLERFRREARAAARLHHTNIVPVFGVGEHAGIHYYAMQFIHGQGLNDVLEEVRRLRKNKGASPPVQSVSASVAESLLSGQFVGKAPVVPPAACTMIGTAVAQTPQEDARTAPPPSSSQLSSQPETRYFHQVAQIGVQVAEALEYAHGGGVLHRDIKPSNLLMDIHGRVWVTDFGLAKTDETEEVTDPGDIVGTLCYMAPERFQGRADARSDVYGLGITLYEMATLQAAFANMQRGQLINKVTHEEPPRPRKLDRKIPHDLETIILKAIAKEPAQRYPTAATLAEDLRRFVADRPIRARRAPLWERLWRWCRRNPAWAGLSGSVVGLVLVIVVGSLISASLFRKEAGKARQAERAARDKAYKALVAQAQAERWGGRPGRRFDSLRALQEAVELERALDQDRKESLELRNEAIACLTLVDMRLEKTWEVLPTEHCAVAFDASLQRYAYSDGQGTIKVCKLADGQEISSLAGPGVPAIELRFSPDGRFLAAAYTSRIQVWELLERSVCIQLFQAFLGFDWSADSRQLVIGREDKSIGVYALPAGTERKRLAVDLEPLRLAIDPSGLLVAFSARTHPSVQIRELASGRLVAELAAKDLLEPVAWAGDGRFLAAGGTDRNLYVWEVYDQHGRLSMPRPEPVVLRGHESKPITVKFNHAADILASAGWDGTIRLWNPWTGKQLLTAAGAWTFQFSPDDTRLASTLGGGKAGLWRVEAGSVCRALRGRSWRADHLWGVDFSSDGRLLASAGTQGVRLWDVEFGTDLGCVATGQHECVLFQPDSSGLIAYGPAGLRRWPIQLHRRIAKTTGPLAVWSAASPQTLHVPAPPGTNTRACWAPGGASLALTDMSKGEALVLNLKTGSQKMHLGPHSNVSFISMSPDGKWVATGHWKGAGMKVWDALEGNLVKEFPADEAANVCFSPDGHWLVTGTTTEYSFWEVESWRCVHRVPRDRASLPGRMAFSPDGALLAVTSSNHIVQLLDPATAEEIATLSSPDSLLISWLCFSRDGSRLAVAAENHVLQLWDLRRIREELAAMGLDWREAAYPPRQTRADFLPIQLKTQIPEQCRFEAEDLPILRAANCLLIRQPMHDYDPKRWSNDHQLFGAAAKGDFVTLGIDVPITARYRLNIFFTKAHDYGIVEIALDGKPIGERFDGFNKAVVPSGKVSFGNVHLTEGIHELRFTAVDKNGESSNYFLGIDYLELKPVD